MPCLDATSIALSVASMMDGSKYASANNLPIISFDHVSQSEAQAQAQPLDGSAYRGVEPATSPDVPVVAREEARGGWAVCTERHAVPAQDREEDLLPSSDEGVVLPLVDGGPDESTLVANVDDLLHLLSGVVRQAPVLDLALRVGLVHGLAGLLERSRPVRQMEVLDVDLFDLERGEGDVNLLEDLGLGVAARLHGHDLGVDGEPLSCADGTDPGLRGVGRLRRVHAGGVQVAVPAFGEDVEERVHLVGAVKMGHGVACAVADLKSC